MITRPLRALVLKDLRVFFSDRRAVILSFAAPIVIASIFASMSPGGGKGAGTIPVLVVDEDQSPLSREVIAGLAADKNLSIEAASAPTARTKVRNGESSVAVVVSKGFGESASKALLNAGPKPELALLTDPTHSAEAGMVRGLLTQHVMEVVSRDAFSGRGGATALQEAETRLDENAEMPDPLKNALRSMFREVRRVREEAGATVPSQQPGSEPPGARFSFGAPFEVQEEIMAAGNQADHDVMAAHAFAGMTVQFILFASIEAGVGLLAERQRGLWRRLRSAPLSRFTLLAGKTISQTLISLLITAVVFGFGVVLFHIRFSGSLIGFLLVAAGYALAAATFGLLIAALGKTPQAARGVAIMAVLLMVLLGGAWMPSFMFPQWLQSVTPVLPTRWAVDGLEGATWRGLGLAPLLMKAAVLLGFSILFGCLATVRFRWEE